MNTGLFINGKFIETEEKVKIINPSSEEVIAEVSLAQDKQAELALESARNAFDKGPWGKSNFSQRKDILLKIHRGILDRAQDLARIESLNTGKPIKETTFMDIPSAAETFLYFAENSEKLLAGGNLEINAQVARVKAVLDYEPFGVALLIIPWNYPLLIASWKLAQALACGNSVILKPSSLTPLSALILAEIIQESGIPEGAVNILCGSGQRLGNKLCSDKRIDMISFTGSNEVGKMILEYTALNVKKTIMELGGKSASIIFRDTDLVATVNSSLCSIFLNQGQMCTAMSRILVEDSVYDEFIQLFVQNSKKIKLGDALDFQTQMGPLISKEQREKVISFVKKAKAQGAEILCGGKIPQDLQKGFYFQPTVLSGIKPQSDIFTREIFGPVACISRFKDAQEAVALANSTDFALAASIWTKDLKKAEETASGLNAGTIWINNYGMFFNELPYGGFKQSGFGKELGQQGLLEYARLKNKIFDNSADSKPLVSYWYGF